MFGLKEHKHLGTLAPSHPNTLLSNMSPSTDIVPLPLPALPAQPLVSVLIANYNYGHFIGRSLDSLLAQSYPHFEGIVCDDGSTDDSREVVARYASRDARIRLLEKENGGVASALNAAYHASRGDVVCLLDADDFFAPDKLEQVVACFKERPEIGLVLHAMQVVDSREQRRGRLPSYGRCEEGWLAETVCARGGRWRSMPASALTFRRTVAERLFSIPEASFRSEADGFLVMLAALLTKVAFLPETLASYRLHGANLTGTRHLDQAVVTRSLDALRRKNVAVNQRLTELGIDGQPLALADNLNYHEQRFMLALFEGAPRRDLLRAYRCLARALRADDLYPPARKAGGLAAFGAAIFLPVAARTVWLNRLLGARGFRRVAQALRC